MVSGEDVILAKTGTFVSDTPNDDEDDLETNDVLFAKHTQLLEPVDELL